MILSTSTPHYISSNKFQLPATIIYTLIGVVAAIFIGIIYAVISYFSPIIVIDALLLFGIYYVISTLSKQLTQKANSRNRIINMIMTLLMGLSAYYASLVTFMTLLFNDSYQVMPLAWLDLSIRPDIVYDALFNYIIPNREITITNSGQSSNGFGISGPLLMVCYGLELLFFIAPTLFSTKVDFFCESCQKWYKKYCFTSFDQGLDEKIAQSSTGSYAEALDNIELYQQYRQMIPSIEPDTQRVNILLYEYYICPSCQRNSLLNIKRYELKKNDKAKKNKLAFNLEARTNEHLVQAAYIDTKTDELFALNKTRLY